MGKTSMAAVTLLERRAAVRSRLLVHFGEIARIEMARRRKRAALLARAFELADSDAAAARRCALEIVSRWWENGLGWVERDSSGAAPLHVRAWELLAALGEKDERRRATCAAMARLAAEEVSALNYGLGLLMKNRFMEAALRFYEAGRIGRMYARRMASFSRARTSARPPAATLFLGYAYMLSNQPLKALRLFTEITSKDPDNAEAWGARGSVLDVLGREKEARGCYARVREIMKRELADPIRLSPLP